MAGLVEIVKHRAVLRLHEKCNTMPQEQQEHPNATAPIPSTTQRVYDAVQELRELGQEATRHTVAQLTGLKMSVVDDRLRTLADEGRLRRLVRGGSTTWKSRTHRRAPCSLASWRMAL